MTLSFQLSLCRLQPARPSSISRPSHVFNSFPKSHRRRFPLTPSCRRAADVRIGVKDVAASRQVKMQCIFQEEGRLKANNDLFVVKTLDRKTLWEMQTPQVLKPDLLRAGFELVNREGLEVTDDVSIVEHLKHPVYITQGSYTNIKVTTPDDLLLAERIINLEET